MSWEEMSKEEFEDLLKKCFESGESPTEIHADPQVVYEFAVSMLEKNYAVEERLAEAKRALAESQAREAQAQALVVKLRGLLKEIEWGGCEGRDFYHCPSCGEDEGNHMVKCALYETLSLISREGE